MHFLTSRRRRPAPGPDIYEGRRMTSSSLLWMVLLVALSLHKVPMYFECGKMEQ